MEDLPRVSIGQPAPVSQSYFIGRQPLTEPAPKIPRAAPALSQASISAVTKALPQLLLKDRIRSQCRAAPVARQPRLRPRVLSQIGIPKGGGNHPNLRLERGIFRSAHHTSAPRENHKDNLWWSGCGRFGSLATTC